VIKVGGKQYRVEQGQTLLVDRQPVDARQSFKPEGLFTRRDDGLTHTPEVLCTGGEAVVTDRAKLADTVSASVVEHIRGPKIKVFKFKPKSGYKRTNGHRSELSRITIESIVGAKKPRTRKKAAAEPEQQEVAADGA